MPQNQPILEFLPQHYFPLGCWVMKFTMFCHLTKHILYFKLAKICPLILEKKTNAQPTTDDDGRQRIVTGPLSDPGDLEINRTDGRTEERRTTGGRYF